LHPFTVTVSRRTEDVEESEREERREEELMEEERVMFSKVDVMRENVPWVGERVMRGLSVRSIFLKMREVREIVDAVVRERGQKEEANPTGSESCSMLTPFILTAPTLTLTRLNPTDVPVERENTHDVSPNDVPDESTRELTPVPRFPTHLNWIFKKDNSPPSPFTSADKSVNPRGPPNTNVAFKSPAAPDSTLVFVTVSLSPVDTLPTA
jgi:hypothetical protein